MYIFHLTTQEKWDLAQKKGVYSPNGLKDCGFIHCSHTSQILEVANMLFKEEKRPLILKIVDSGFSNSNILKEETPLEAPYSVKKFPHLYGELSLKDVVDVFYLLRDDEGNFFLPEDLI